MNSVFFVIPAHGRLELAEACLRQLRRSCDSLAAGGLDACAVIVADDANLEIAQSLGFATVQRENEPLGRKWNDGYELAARIAGADYVIPFGSDDWIDPVTLLELPLPQPNEIRCFRQSAIVSEDGTRLARLTITYDGGDGVRVIPTALLEPLGYRPAEEDRPRAIDTSTWNTIRGYYPPDKRPKFVYHDLHPLQIVDWKSHGHQLNPYDDCSQGFREGPELDDPFGALAEHYPQVAIEEMRALYAGVPA